MDSLNNYESLILLKFLNVKHSMLAVTRGCQKSIETPVASQVLPGDSLCNSTECHRLQPRLDLSGLPGFFNFGFMLKPQIQCRQTGRRIAKGIYFGNRSCQNKMVDSLLHAPRCQQSCYAWYSACCVLRASSRSTVFIIDEGPVSAFFFETVK